MNWTLKFVLCYFYLQFENLFFITSAFVRQDCLEMAKQIVDTIENVSSMNLGFAGMRSELYAP